ncbi:MAG: hypothetical protein Q9213_006315 [Squamulea squamosa]
MDPISPIAIVSAVSVIGVNVCTISAKLYIFIRATKAIDKSIEALYTEIKGLENVIKSAQGTLSNALDDFLGNPFFLAAEAWDSIKGAVDDCQITVETLTPIVQNVASSKPATNLFQWAFRQVKLELSADEVEAVRSRIHTHTMCLQLSMQMLIVSVNCSTLSMVDQTIVPGLDAITSKLEELSSLVLHMNFAQNLEASKLPKSFRNPDLQIHTQQLKRSADSVLNTASTTVGSLPSNPGGYSYKSSNISELGIPLASSERACVAEWIRDINISEHSVPTESNSDPDLQHPTVAIAHPRTIRVPDISFTSQTPVAIKVANECFKKAELHWAAASHEEVKVKRDDDKTRPVRRYKKDKQVRNCEKDNLIRNYEKAEESFRIGLEQLNNVPFSEAALNLAELRLRRGFCALQIGHTSLAHYLFEQLRLGRETPPGVIQDACFGLSQVYLCTKKLDKAELWCQQCVEGYKATDHHSPDMLYRPSL